MHYHCPRSCATPSTIRRIRISPATSSHIRFLRRLCPIISNASASDDRVPAPHSACGDINSLPLASGRDPVPLHRDKHIPCQSYLVTKLKQIIDVHFAWPASQRRVDQTHRSQASGPRSIGRADPAIGCPSYNAAICCSRLPIASSLNVQYVRWNKYGPVDESAPADGFLLEHAPALPRSSDFELDAFPVGCFVGGVCCAGGSGFPKSR